MDDQQTLVVRAIGSGRCHVARVDPADLLDATMIGRPCRLVGLDPVATVCGAQLRESRGSVVVMSHAKVDCRPCARLSGVAEVHEVTS